MERTQPQTSSQRHNLSDDELKTIMNERFGPSIEQEIERRAQQIVDQQRQEELEQERQNPRRITKA